MSVLSADNDIPTATPEESAEAATEAASQSIPTAIPTPTPGVTVVETPTPGATVVETPTPGGTVAFVGDTPPSMTPTPTPKSNKKKKKKKTGFDEYNAADDMPEQKKIARPLMVCIRFYTESEAESTLFMHVSSHRLAGAKRRGNSLSIRVTIP